jgi:hypothetical protein
LRSLDLGSNERHRYRADLLVELRGHHAKIGARRVVVLREECLDACVTLRGVRARALDDEVLPVRPCFVALQGAQAGTMLPHACSPVSVLFIGTI